tara:strand:- start:1354 stop:2238 length:885 start_codon:yes stop_codon:yes gene_type:complete
MYLNKSETSIAYDEYKKGFHKKKMPEGKYITYNNIDLAIRYKDKYLFYKDYGNKMKFWKIYKGKQTHHSKRPSAYPWIKINCIECNKSYYIFKCNRSTRPGCTQECRQKITYKERERNNTNSYRNPGVYQEHYPTFLDENGKRKRCHVHSMELHLDREMKKGEVIHHIDMLKSNYHIDNLYLCDNSLHQIAHGSMNELVHILIEKEIVKFNIETGKYYLKEKEMCELCGSEEGIRRNDNIHVCDECNDKYPVRALDEEELVSNCCSALFTHPGWPDSDICSDCKEHADIGVDDE